MKAAYEVARLLTYVTGMVNSELLLQVEYLVAENRILRTHAPVRLWLTNAERGTLAESANGSGERVWLKSLRLLSPRRFSAGTGSWWPRSSTARATGRTRGGPRIDRAVENLIVQMARENSGWGYDRIAGALANLGHEVSDQTVGNVLRRHGIAPAPKRRQTTAWKDFIAAHMAVLAGMDFFTAEVLTWRGPATYYVLFVIQLETRRVTLAGMTRHPTEEWMQQMARNLTDADAGALRYQRYLLH